MSIVVEYLENIRKLGLTGKQMEFYDFLLENGKSFEFQIYENDVPPFIRRQQCFNNSFLMATCGDDSIEYYEDFMFAEIFRYLSNTHLISKEMRSKFQTSRLKNSGFP